MGPRLAAKHHTFGRAPPLERAPAFRPGSSTAFHAVPSPSTYSRPWPATFLPGLPNLRVTVPPQRFSRSRGFHPSTLCRPYFMPVPSLGFHPSGSLPTRGAARSLERRFPLVVFEFPLPRFQHTRLCQSSRKGLASARRTDFPEPTFAKPRFSKPDPLQGLAPRECPYLQQAV